MKNLDESTLNRLLCKKMNEENIDFIAWVMSHWHAVGIDVFVHDISQQKNKKPKGIIIILSHPKDGFVISKADFICKDFAEVEFYFLDACNQNNQFTFFTVFQFIRKTFHILLATKRMKNKIKIKRRIYLASVINPKIDFIQNFKNKHLANKYVPVFSLIDEGIGTYASKKVWDSISKLAIPSNKLKNPKYVKTLKLLEIFDITNSLLKNIVLTSIKSEERFLFSKKQGKLIPIWPIVNSYKNVLEKRKKSINKIKDTRPLAIILPQHFEGSNTSGMERNLNLIEEIVNILIKKGLFVVIKPHPRGNIDTHLLLSKKFKPGQVEVIQQKKAIEDFFLTLNPACIIGYTSTALINATIFYNIPSISLDTILNNIVGNILNNSTKQMIDNTVQFPKDLDELESILNNIDILK